MANKPDAVALEIANDWRGVLRRAGEFYRNNEWLYGRSRQLADDITAAYEPLVAEVRDVLRQLENGVVLGRPTKLRTELRKVVGDD